MYEFLRGETDNHSTNEIRLHLDSCDRCTMNVSEIGSLLEAMSATVHDPASLQDESYWVEQKRVVLDRVSRKVTPGSSPVSSAATTFPESFITRWAFATAGVALVALLTVLFANPDPDPGPAESTTKNDDQRSMERYWRQSRSLLVGLSHMEIPDNEAVDLSAERELSKELVLQGRSIQKTDIDRESYELISDLDQVMEHVSATREAPGLETIRQEIRGRNLLIKVRMAEASASAPAVLRVSNGQ